MLRSDGRLRELARLCLLDVVINNLDRLPVLWDNAGNLNNLMLGPDGLVGIDQAVALDRDSLEDQNW